MNHAAGWQPVQKARIEIDFSACKYASEIHEAIKTAFGFPADYGANWSAFWDYLDDFCGDLDSECHIVIRGLSSLSYPLREYAEGMLEVLRDAEEKYPRVKLSIASVP